MFDPLEFFYFANSLHKEPPKLVNAAARSSVSRAYYAAFLVARDEAGITSKSGSIHRDVDNYYSKKDKRVANQLKVLKTLRSDADYELKKSVTDRETGKALRLASEILAKLGKTLDDH